MDLIERYLGAVGALLPRGQKADITAELRDVLLNRREEKEAGLGRKLTRDEEADLLRGFGHPIQVAGRYGPQQALIGPEMYPVFVFVLKIVLAIIAVAGLVAASVNLTFDGAAVDQPGPAIVTALAVWWNGTIITVGVLTIVFTVLERTGAPLLDKWDPRRLPAQPRRRRQGWFEHLAAVAVQVVGLLWWIHVVRFWSPDIPISTGGKVTLGLAPVFTGLYWPVVGLFLATIASHLVQASGRRTAGLAVDTAAQLALAALGALALRADRWVTVTASGPNVAVPVGLDYGVNLGIHITLIVVVVTGLGTAAYDVWRLTRPSDER